MATEAQELGPVALAWIRWSERVLRRTLSKRATSLTPLDSQELIEVRPPCPVDHATDTIIGWDLDQRWLG